MADPINYYDVFKTGSNIGGHSTYGRFPYEMPVQRNTSGGGMNLGAMAGGAGMLGLGAMTGGTGFVISGLLTLAGGIIQGLTQRKPPRSAQDIYFADMTNYYYKLGQRMGMSNTVKKMFNPNSVFKSVSYSELVRTVPYTSTISSVTKSDTSGGEE